MNFQPQPQPLAPPPDRKPLFIGVTIVSWAIIAASVTAILVTVTGSPEGSVAAGNAPATEAGDTDEGAASSPFDESFMLLERAFAEGDRDTWMSVFDTSVDDTATRAGRYFDNLQALRADPLEFRVIGDVSEYGTGTQKSYSTRIGLSFCLAAADPSSCHRSEVDYHVDWQRDGDELVVTRFKDVTTGFYRPQAWEAVELDVAVGDRAVVAAPAGSDVDPRDHLAVADAAAKHADTFALIAPVPSYVVILASNQQFNTWYGGYENDVSLGYAAPTIRDIEENEVSGPIHVMLPYERHDDRSAADTLRHEFGHTATLQGAHLRAAENDETWWMMEGIAEYIAYGDTMPRHRVSETKALVAAGGCADGIESHQTGDSADVASGKYGCSYLAVRYMVDTYGLDVFLEWFQAFHHERGNAAVTRDVLEEDHAAVMAAIGAYIDGAA